MHVIVVNYAYRGDLSDPEQLLNAFIGFKGWVDGLAEAGLHVTIFQRFHLDDSLILNDAQYHFVSDDLPPRLKIFHIPLRLHRKISLFVKELNLDCEDIVFHINGLVFPLQTLHLQLSVSRKCSFIVQHHAEKPGRVIARIAQRIGLRFVDGFMFSTKYHAKNWKQAGVIHQGHLIGEIMETSSTLNYEDRSLARVQTNLTGNPILLWTGNLNDNKDPMTILKGLERVLKVRSGARLYMAFREDSLLSQVKEYIHSSDILAKSVSLLGCIPYSRIDAYYNSADFFVQGSHHEGSGIALLDALACGAVPVVTDIPSFRIMTDQGRVGALWPAGDSQAFAEALISLFDQPIDRLSMDAREHFEKNFSFKKLGQKACRFYSQVNRQKSRH